MENKLVLDSFSYRSNRSKDKVELNNPGTEFIPFKKIEKEYYIGKILNGALIHDKICVKINALYELVDLLSLNDLNLLVENEIIEIIDDQGIAPKTNISVRKKSEVDNEDIDLYGDAAYLRFSMFDSENPSFALEKLLEKFNNVYYGKSDLKLAKRLLYNIESNKVDIDGKQFNEYLIKEAEEDIKNKALRALFNIKSQEIDDLNFFEYLPMHYLSMFNRSVIYQYHLKAKYSESNALKKQFLQAKFSPINQCLHQEDNIELFSKLLKLKKVPDLGHLYIENELGINEYLEIRNSKSALKFKDWFFSKDGDSDGMLSDLLNSKPRKNILKVIRYTIPQLISIKLPIVGAIVDTVNTFILDKLLQGWTPNFFFDDTLKTILINKEASMNKRKEENRIRNIYRKIGRNDLCPCGSGKKFKFCHGKL